MKKLILWEAVMAAVTLGAFFIFLKLFSVDFAVVVAVDFAVVVAVVGAVVVAGDINAPKKWVVISLAVEAIIVFSVIVTTI
ncbi:MAG: hypothetical protein COV00_02250 [Candidatus Tagabacteria bacterium CG10_big_fil_rev_8_21_14_0_10_40_13]|uniref:Uncharacterized protein n=1 Tax=Candidatus Tagabacteria bacterium CG10_big_fil_rev_8_21_14_0_10_40_13 TaxID=1975022 RepID=A0A2M8L8P2_9BACT|nr:MAG: hypothetical protein COV00_02250 [Candidatus Tagabacteria bacterium CG10_big_fil_rev_8_21_14_0_10_40_13]